MDVQRAVRAWDAVGRTGAGRRRLRAMLVAMEWKGGATRERRGSDGGGGDGVDKPGWRASDASPLLYVPRPEMQTRMMVLKGMFGRCGTYRAMGEGSNCQAQVCAPHQTLFTPAKTEYSTQASFHRPIS